jgi:hypothetical protein
LEPLGRSQTPETDIGGWAWLSLRHATSNDYISQSQSTLAEHMALFAKLQGPKRVEATEQEGFICVGGFWNPLF